jgi:hypothetical protein
MLILTWLKYENNVVLHRVNISHFLCFMQQFTLKRIPRNSDQMQPSFTSGIQINNHQKLHVKTPMTCEYNLYIKK